MCKPIPDGPVRRFYGVKSSRQVAALPDPSQIRRILQHDSLARQLRETSPLAGSIRWEREEVRAMGTANIPQEKRIEEWQAEVAAATCRATRETASKGAFIDAALDLWHAVQTNLRQSSAPASA
jgi:hypothetical protein